MAIFKLNKNITVFCDSYGNRSGFVHYASLYYGDNKMLEHKVQYYNRTREAYTYQTVLYWVVREFLFNNWSIYEKNREVLQKIKEGL
jgi:hypothetical protein